MANCSESFPYTSILYPELEDDVFVIVVGVVAVILLILNLLNYAEELWFLCRINPHSPNRQGVIFILTMFPVLSLCCVLGLLVPRSTLFMELVTSSLRAISLFIYMKILIGYFGGEDKLLGETSRLTITFQTPPCCCCLRCIRGSPITSRTLRIITFLNLQLVVIRPFTMLILFLLWVDNKFLLTDHMSTSNPGTYFQFVNIISLLFSMWGVIALTKAVAHALPESRIRAKFFSVQLTIVFSEAQGTILTLLASRGVIDCVATRGPMVQAYRYHYTLLVLETFLLSLLARYAFRFQDPPYKYNQIDCAKDDSVND
ncbi:organic solute transporter subunit alpha-like [Crassostrea virginica]